MKHIGWGLILDWIERENFAQWTQKWRYWLSYNDNISGNRITKWYQSCFKNASLGVSSPSKSRNICLLTFLFIKLNETQKQSTINDDGSAWSLVIFSRVWVLYKLILSNSHCHGCGALKWFSKHIIVFLDMSGIFVLAC